MTHAEVFVEYRTYLFKLACRLSGSVPDAEDLLQDTFIRWLQASLQEIRSSKAFMATILTNLYVNHVRSARLLRERGEMDLPEGREAAAGVDQARILSLSDSISQALWVLLERLSPLERLVFLLHAVFDYNYSEISSIAQKNAANCRQIFCRARQRLLSGGKSFLASTEEHEKLLWQFMYTCASGDLDSLVRLLSPSEELALSHG